LNHVGANNVTLVITGGLRIAEDFAKALMLGADAIAISNAAIQAVGCLGMRACHTNNCPVGIATQKESLRGRIKIESSARQLSNFLNATTELMKVVARACGYDDFKKFNPEDLTTFNRELHHLTGISYAGVRLT
jgi:glutamate synthase domain-containing protein 2